LAEKECYKPENRGGVGRVRLLGEIRYAYILVEVVCNGPLGVEKVQFLSLAGLLNAGLQTSVQLLRPSLHLLHLALVLQLFLLNLVPQLPFKSRKWTKYSHLLRNHLCSLYISFGVFRGYTTQNLLWISFLTLHIYFSPIANDTPVRGPHYSVLKLSICHVQLALIIFNSYQFSYLFQIHLSNTL